MNLTRYIAGLWATIGLAFCFPTNSTKNLEIVGGEDADIREFPYQLSLRFDEEHLCGASLITTSVALTAAHCTTEREVYRMSVLAGATDHRGPGEIAYVFDVIEHPNYRSYYHFDNDCSILKLDRTFTLSETVQTVLFPPPGVEPPHGTMCVVTGWGSLTEKKQKITDTLRKVYVPIVDREVCRQYVYGITDNMVCAGYKAGGKDACGGDSGGALVCSGRLVGIVSWGHGCAQPDTPGVYANVARFRDFIKRFAGV